MENGLTLPEMLKIICNCHVLFMNSLHYQCDDFYASSEVFDIKSILSEPILDLIPLYLHRILMPISLFSAYFKIFLLVCNRHKEVIFFSLIYQWQGILIGEFNPFIHKAMISNEGGYFVVSYLICFYFLFCNFHYWDNNISVAIYFDLFPFCKFTSESFHGWNHCDNFIKHIMVINTYIRCL